MKLAGIYPRLRLHQTYNFKRPLVIGALIITILILGGVVVRAGIQKGYIMPPQGVLHLGPVELVASVPFCPQYPHCLTVTEHPGLGLGQMLGRLHAYHYLIWLREATGSKDTFYTTQDMRSTIVNIPLEGAIVFEISYD